MRHFVIAAAVAVGLGLGFANKADAQIVYGYNVPAGGGIVSGGTAYGPGGYQTFQRYYSPWTGQAYGQMYGANVLGQTYGRSFGYNPWLGLGYRTGFYQPYPFTPLGGYNYGFVRRW
jgi:hypothetical protein